VTRSSTRTLLLASALALTGCASTAPVHSHTVATPEGNPVAPANEGGAEHVQDHARETATNAQRPIAAERPDVGAPLSATVVIEEAD